MEKIVSVYQLSLMEKRCVQEETSIFYTVFPEGRNRFKPISNPDELMPTEIQDVKIHRIIAQDAVTLDQEKYLPDLNNPESIFKRQVEEIGEGRHHLIEDAYPNHKFPTKIYRTYSHIGIFFDTGIPHFLRRAFDPTYVQEIETENREYKRDLHIASEDLRSLIARLDRTKLILDGPITGLVRYRLQGWWKKYFKKNNKEKQ